MAVKPIIEVLLLWKNSAGSKSHIECDTILMDGESSSDTILSMKSTIQMFLWSMKQRFSKVSEEQLYYIMSRGISEEEHCYDYQWFHGSYY